MKKLLTHFLCVLLAVGGTTIQAAGATTDWSAQGVHVRLIEATYMPTMITLKIDAPAGACAANSLDLEYRPQGPDSQSQRDNIRAVYALLLAAKLSGQTVNLYGSNTSPDPGFCLVQFVHME